MSPDVMELQVALQKEFKQPAFLFVLPESYMLQLNDLRKVIVPHSFSKDKIDEVIAGLKPKKDESKPKKKAKSKKND